MEQLVGTVSSRDELKKILSTDTYKNRDTNKVLYPYKREIDRINQHPDSYTFGTTKYQGSNNAAIKDYAKGMLDLANLTDHLTASKSNREGYQEDTKKLLGFLGEYEQAKNAKWSPAQKRLIDQRNNGEINDDTFKGEITKYKYGKFTEFHEPMLEAVLAKEQKPFGYEAKGDNRREYRKWMEDNAGIVNRAGVEAFTTALKSQEPLITRFKTGSNGQTIGYKEVNHDLREGFGKLADKIKSLYVEKGILPNKAWEHFTPEESQIARDGRQQLDSLFSAFTQKWVKGDMTNRDKIGRVAYKDPTINYRSLDTLNNIEHDVDWKYLDTSKLDKNKGELLDAYKADVGGNLEKVKIETTLDTRGRNYQNLHKANDNKVINPLANQDIKPIRATISFSNKQRVDDMDELKIHTANQWGLDKKTYGERIKWFDENAHNLENMISSADEPEMAQRAVDEYKNALAGRPTGLVAYADAISSGIQLKAALHSDPLTLSLTGGTTTERPDLYTHVADALKKKNIVDRPISRSTAKDAIMQGGYGSSQVGKKIIWETYKRDINKVIKDTPFTPSNITPDILNHDKYQQFKVDGLSNESAFKLNEDKIRDFHHKFQHDAMFRKLQRKKERVLDNTSKFPGLKPYKEKAVQALHEYNDILRSEARFNDAMLDNIDYMKNENLMMMPDGQQAQGRLRNYAHENIGGNRSFAANYIHAYDAWVSREVANAGSLDKKALMDIRYNNIGGRKPLSAEKQALLDHSKDTGYLSNFFLNDLSKAEYNGLDNETKNKVNSMIADLPDKNYQLKIVHDSFGTHPNNMKDVKRQYSNVLRNIYNTKGKLLAHTFKEWTGKDLPYNVVPYEGSDLFKEGNYLIN